MGSTAVNVPSTPAAPPAAAPLSTPAPQSTPAATPSTSPMPMRALDLGDTSLPGDTMVPDLGAILEGLNKPATAPAPVQTEPTQVATPATPETGTQPAPAEGQPVQEFDAIKGQLTEATGKLTAAETKAAELEGKLQTFEHVQPLMETLSVPGAPEMVQMLTPLLKAGLSTDFNDPRGAALGRQVLEALEKYHPGIAGAIHNGVAALHETELLNTALERVGMDRASLNDFQAWKGGVRTPYYSQGEFPKLDQVNAETGYLKIPLAEGGTYDVDPNDSKDMRIYNSEKRVFEQHLAGQREQAERQRIDTERAKADSDRLAAQQKAATDKRVNDFFTAHNESQAETYKSLNPAFTGEFAKFEDAVQALSSWNLARNPDYARLARQGHDAAVNGAAVQAQIRDSMNRMAKHEITSWVTYFSDVAKELSDLRGSKAGGVVVPDSAPAITPETKVIATPQAQTPQQVAQPANQQGPLPGEDMMAWIERQYAPIGQALDRAALNGR